MYDLSQLSMKFERHLDAEVVDFQARRAQNPVAVTLTTLSPDLCVSNVLTVCKATPAVPPRTLQLKRLTRIQEFSANVQILDDDYSKAAFLCADRSVTLHAKFGAYYRTRIPKAGRSLAYAPFTAGAAGALMLHRTVVAITCAFGPVTDDKERFRPKSLP